MNPEEFKARTKEVCLARHTPGGVAWDHESVGHVIGGQLLRSGTSVGAGAIARHAGPGRARCSFQEWGVVEEECDEAIYWMELLVESRQMKPSRMDALMNEAGELLAMVIASSKTAKGGGNPRSAIRNPKMNGMGKSLTKSLKITVMLGGPSAEREVSLRTGTAVVRALRSLRHTVHELDPKEPTWICRMTRRWYFWHCMELTARTERYAATGHAGRSRQCGLRRGSEGRGGV